MTRSRSTLAGPSRPFSLAVAGLLLASLAALAALQWRWIGEVSALDRQRLHSSLIGAGTRFTEDFDREVTRAFLTFLPADGSADPRERVVSQLERWLDEAPYPGLISELYLAGGAAPALGPAGELAVLNPAERRFEERPWPSDLAAATQLRRARSPAGPALQRFLLPEVPGLRVPLAPAELAAVHDFRRRAETEADALEAVAPRGQLILRLDAATIAEQILPELTRRHFGSAEGTEYAVLVTAANDADRVFFRSDPDLALSEFRDADVRLQLFSLRLFPDLHDPAAGTTIRWRFGREREGAGSERHRGHQPREEAAAIVHHAADPESAVDEGGAPAAGPPPAGRLRRLRLDGGEGDGGWVLAVKRRDGSLEQAVGAIRRRNLAVSSGILGVLLITTGTLLVTAQRARRLARQQIEFVAGVTHELHTPLTAIRSAGENLADGVVAGPEQVRRYGRLIEGEGRRLSGMVGQLLELAGIQSGRRNYRMEPTAVAAIVEGALADSRWLLAEARIEVESEIAGGLPPVNGDLAALKRALQNLIENAVKYGGEARWLRVEARLGSGGRGDVEIAVADRGPGIPAADLPHLFEPFYRGSAASSANVTGSGLGLALVRHVAEAHGGGVRVEGAPAGPAGAGSVFVLHLPAAESGLGGATAPTPAA